MLRGKTLVFEAKRSRVQFPRGSLGGRSEVLWRPVGAETLETVASGGLWALKPEKTTHTNITRLKTNDINMINVC